MTSSSHRSLFPIAGEASDGDGDDRAAGEEKWLKLSSHRADTPVDATDAQRRRRGRETSSSTSPSASRSSSPSRQGRERHDGKKKSKSSSRGKHKKRKTSEAEKIARAEERMGATVKDRRVGDGQMWEPSARSMATTRSYQDSRGDRDNLAYGVLARGDAVKFKRVDDRARAWYERAAKVRSSAFYGLSLVGKKAKELEVAKKERYFSGVASMRARDRRMPKLRKPALIKREEKDSNSEFVALRHRVSSNVGNGDGAAPVEDDGMESVNAYLMRRTKMFNQAARESPHDVKVWIDFAQFQDQFLALTNKRAEAAQLIEKKITILEQALRHHPNNETLLLMLMSETEKIEESSAVLSQWNRICERNYHNPEIWHAFIRYRKRDFNTFSVSQIRGEYDRALRSLAAARRLVKDDLHESEFAIIDFIVEACRFDMQCGSTERAVARLQAAVEFGCFSPTGVSEAELLDSFETFWECGEPRVGEENAKGWSHWFDANAALKSKLELQARHANQPSTDVPPPPPPPPTLAREEVVLGGGWEDFDKNADIEKYEENEDENDDSVVDEDADDVEPDAVAIARLEEQLEAAEDREVDDDIINRWIAKESERDKNWLPIRLMDADEPDDDVGTIGIIDFDEIKHGLSVFTSPAAQVRLCKHVLRLLAQAEDFEPDAKNNEFGKHIDYIENVEATRQPYSHLAKAFTKFEMSKESEADIAVASENVWLFQMEGIENAWDTNEPTRVTFVRSMRRAFASRFPQEVFFTNLLKPNAEQVKHLLSGAHGNSLELWANLAVMEGQGHHKSLSRKIFTRAFASAPSLGVSFGQSVSHLAWSWVSQELREDPLDSKNHAKSVLCSLAHMSLGKLVQPDTWTDDKQSLRQVKTAFEQMAGRALLGGGVLSAPNLPSKDSSLYGLQSHGVALLRCYDTFLNLTGDADDVIDVILNDAGLETQRRMINAPHWHELHCVYISKVSGHRKRSSIERALRVFPISPVLLLEMCALEYEVQGKQRMRRYLDLALESTPSALLVFCSLGLEVSKPLASNPRAISVFERALDRSAPTSHTPLLWLIYMRAYVMSGRMSNAKTVFLRAVNAVPWSKSVWLYGLSHIRHVFTANERSALIDVMREKEITIRTDMYEILLESAVDA